MPELLVPKLTTVALSEPIEFGGSVIFAAERPDRSRIDVWAPFDVLGSNSWAIIESFPGGPTDNGTRAQWPRMDESGSVAYQRGGTTAIDDIWSENVAYGNWPIAINELAHGGTFLAPATTSQGAFGYLDGRWWLFDDIWQSIYAAAYPTGTLFHGWRDQANVLHLIFKDDKGTVLCTDAGGQWNRYRVFRGHSEYPRGCSRANGKIYIHAVSETGQYRAAESPFERLEEEGEQPMPTIRVVATDMATTVAPGGLTALVETTGAGAFVKRIRPKVIGAEWIEETRTDGPGMTLQTFHVNDPGTYEFMFAISGGPETSVRTFTVGAAPKPEPPVVTTVDAQALDDMLEVISTKVWEVAHEGLSNERVTSQARYATLRAAGQSHESALGTVTAEAWAFVREQLA